MTRNDIDHRKPLSGPMLGSVLVAMDRDCNAIDTKPGDEEERDNRRNAWYLRPSEVVVLPLAEEARVRQDCMRLGRERDRGSEYNDMPQHLSSSVLRLTGTIDEPAANHGHDAGHRVDDARVSQCDGQRKARYNHDGREPVAKVEEGAA